MNKLEIKDLNLLLGTGNTKLLILKGIYSNKDKPGNSNASSMTILRRNRLLQLF